MFLYGCSSELGFSVLCLWVWGVVVVVVCLVVGLFVGFVWWWVCLLWVFGLCCFVWCFGIRMFVFGWVGFWLFLFSGVRVCWWVLVYGGFWNWDLSYSLWCCCLLRGWWFGCCLRVGVFVVGLLVICYVM